MVQANDRDLLASQRRLEAIRGEDGRLLIANFVGTEQEKDLSEPPNCGGLGRIRHFRRQHNPRWLKDPLPIGPACTALALPATDEIRAQVFQISVCSWRCWYCFSDDCLRAGDPSHAEWKTTDELLDLYLLESDRPVVIDLSGGQPELTPEWVVWMMDSLARRSLEGSVYLWSDDSLSNDYLWRELSSAEIRRLADYRNYGRVGCFKGFDARSFVFNTGTGPERWQRQFELFSRLLTLGIDLYGYVTLTCPESDGLRDRMSRFVDRLQRIHPMLPLRTIPLEIVAFHPVLARLNPARSAALENQYRAAESWREELSRRYTSAELDMPITAVHL